VRFDGALSAQYDTSQIGDILGYLPQRVELFDGTIAENISRFRADATPEAIIAAARAAKVHDLILSFPRGYDSPVGDQGQLLSAGQNQRIGLARALYGNPFLVVLDEPDSNLDAEGDAALAEAIALAKGRGAVVLVVAHRPGILAIVDKVLVMREGRQIAFGPRNEVLAELEPVKPGGNVRTIRMPVA
jgi:ATP-binding cassette subfamily C protein PrsD